MTLPGTPDPHYSDDDAKEILRRAVEIEKEGVVTASRLREIAAEAQISPEAMNRAIAEAASAKQHAVPAESAVPGTYLSKAGWTLVAIIILAAGLLVIAL
jgi:hypothetical protein